MYGVALRAWHFARTRKSDAHTATRPSGAWFERCRQIVIVQDGESKDPHFIHLLAHLCYSLQVELASYTMLTRSHVADTVFSFGSNVCMITRNRSQTSEATSGRNSLRRELRRWRAALANRQLDSSQEPTLPVVCFVERRCWLSWITCVAKSRQRRWIAAQQANAVRKSVFW